jgi:hypothetical protein
MGRISTPGLRMSIRSSDRPPHFDSFEVRTRTKYQSEMCARVVQIFWPLTT